MTEAKKATAGIDNVNKKLSGIGRTAKVAGAALITGLAGSAVVSGIKSIVGAASDAQQSLGATATVFGKYGDTVVNDSKRAAQAFGLSGNVYRENANLIGSLLKNQGVETSKLAGTTKGMIGTASDLAATFGGSTTSAVEALSSALKGEFDPLEKYGISMKQSTVNTEAYRLANVKGASEFGKLSKAQQTALTSQAKMNIITKQSKSSAGAFAKETNTLAHQQQVLGAQVDNARAALGKRLLPVITKVFSYLSKNGPVAVEAFQKGLAKAEPYIDKFRSIMEKVRGSLPSIVNAIKTFGPAIAAGVVAWLLITKTMAAYKAITTAVKAAQVALNVAMSANPIGLVVIAVAALIAGLVLLYQNSETARNIMNAAFGAIKSVGISVFNALKVAVGVAMKIIATYVKTYIAVVKAVFMGIKATISAVVGFFKTGYTGIKGWLDKIVTWAKGIPGKLKGAFNGAFDGLKNAFKSAVNFIIRGWNRLQFKIPGFDPPGPGPKFGGITIGVPKIPELYHGGIVPGSRYGTTVTLAERGQAEAIIPLRKLNGMGGTTTVHVYLDTSMSVEQRAVEIDKTLRAGRKAGVIK